MGEAASMAKRAGIVILCLWIASQVKPVRDFVWGA
jgi:hypothetical protein